LGKKYFTELERETQQVLVERKIIKGKGMLLDATVFPSISGIDRYGIAERGT